MKTYREILESSELTEADDKVFLVQIGSPQRAETKEIFAKTKQEAIAKAEK